jgi:hypothetical protein
LDDFPEGEFEDGKFVSWKSKFGPGEGIAHLVKGYRGMSPLRQAENESCPILQKVLNNMHYQPIKYNF